MYVYICIYIYTYISAIEEFPGKRILIMKRNTSARGAIMIIYLLLVSKLLTSSSGYLKMDKIIRYEAKLHNIKHIRIKE